MAPGIEARRLFEKSITAVRGEVVWGVIAGRPNGSAFGVRMGERVPVAGVAVNNRLPSLLRRHQGSIHLFVYDAVWRVEGRSRVICGSDGAFINERSMVRGLRSLV